jgi:hypothetical protein
MEMDEGKVTKCMTQTIRMKKRSLLLQLDRVRGGGEGEEKGLFKLDPQGRSEKEEEEEEEV